MSLAEFKAKQAEAEKRQVEDLLKDLSEVEHEPPPFSIPRVDHSAAGTLDTKEEEAMFYATSNKIYGAGNGLSFETKPFRRRGLDGTFTTWAAGDQVSLQVAGDPIWGRQGLDTAYTRSTCLPQPTSWGSIPMEPPTCTGRFR